jgi:hypothetical protein
MSVVVDFGHMFTFVSAGFWNVVMRQPLLPILIFLLICSADIETAFAKGGRGGGRGRSTMQAKNRNHSGRRTIEQQNREQGNRPLSHKRAPLASRPRKENGQVGLRGLAAPAQPVPIASAEGRTGYTQPHDVQLGNEQRKLDHRLRTAERLRENAARNGNQNLLDTADRMEQRAYEHFDSRLRRVSGGVTGVDDLSEGVLQPNRDGLINSNAFDAGDVRGGGSDSLTQHHLNEERKLQHQLDVAQRLRDIATRNGNENLIQTADHMEEMAARRYERQLARFGEWDSDPSFTE